MVAPFVCSFEMAKAINRKLKINTTSVSKRSLTWMSLFAIESIWNGSLAPSLPLFSVSSIWLCELRESRCILICWFLCWHNTIPVKLAFKIDFELNEWKRDRANQCKLLIVLDRVNGLTPSTIRLNRLE